MEKKLLLLFIGIAAIVLAILLVTPTEPVKRIEQFSCEFIKHGEYSCGVGCACYYPTEDAGKICADSDRCEGLCIADVQAGFVSAFQHSEEGQPGSGKCGKKNIQYGPVVTIEDGKKHFQYIVD